MTVPATISTAHDKAAARLLDARGSIRSAFDALDCGVTFNDLIVYIERDFHARALREIAGDPDRFHARLVGVVAGAALTIVESDREAGGAA